jgi:hypothetical protein
MLGRRVNTEACLLAGMPLPRSDNSAILAFAAAREGTMQRGQQDMIGFLAKPRKVMVTAGAGLPRYRLQSDTTGHEVPGVRTAYPTEGL